MKYCATIGLILVLFTACNLFGQDYLPAPEFDETGDMGRPTLTARMATYFPGVGDSTELKLASCETEASQTLKCREIGILNGEQLRQ